MKTDIQNTKWAKKYLEECPTSYKEAIEKSNDPNLNVDIYHNDDAGFWQFSVVDTRDGFWMDSFETEKEAETLILEMGWRLED